MQMAVALGAGLIPLRARAAANPLRIGMIVSSSGPSATNAIQFNGAIKAFVSKHGDTVAGRKIEIIQRDGMGPAPDVNMRITQELIVREKVELIFGYDYTPNVLAVAKMSTQAKMPIIVSNAATSGILKNAPYMVRFGWTTAQITAPLAEWMAREGGIRKAYALFSDYGPGLEAGAVFKERFVGAGGEYLGEIRVPVSNPDFSGYLQRIKDAKPDALFIFLPAGEQPPAFLKAAQDYELVKSKIRLFATGDMSVENTIDAIGEPIIGLVTSFIYSDVHDSPENKEFTRLFAEATGGAVRPNFHAATVFDIMGAIYKLVEARNGMLDPESTVEFLRNYQTVGPRGRVQIDPETRDAIGTVYLRRAERDGDRIVNREFAQIAQVRSPADPIKH